jgi:hypothetical protein
VRPRHGKGGHRSAEALATPTTVGALCALPWNWRLRCYFGDAATSPRRSSPSGYGDSRHRLEAPR